MRGRTPTSRRRRSTAERCSTALGPNVIGLELPRRRPRPPGYDGKDRGGPRRRRRRAAALPIPAQRTGPRERAAQRPSGAEQPSAPPAPAPRRRPTTPAPAAPGAPSAPVARRSTTCCPAGRRRPPPDDAGPDAARTPRARTQESPPRLPPRLMRRGSRIHRRQPRPRRGGDHARRRRRGVPRVQREQRPAVRARRRRCYAELPNGAEVDKGVEVREGGYRIGVVEDLEPAAPAATARSAASCSSSSTSRPGRSRPTRRVIVRPRSPLALKIVEFERGKSKRGARRRRSASPVSQARDPHRPRRALHALRRADPRAASSRTSRASAARSSAAAAT